MLFVAPSGRAATFLCGSGSGQQGTATQGLAEDLGQPQALPIILVGPLADLIGTAMVMLVAAGVVGIAGIVSLVRVRPASRVSAVPRRLIALVAPLAVHTMPMFLEPEPEEIEATTRD